MSGGIHGDAPCPFPDEECIGCLLRLEEPERRNEISRALEKLPEQNEEIVERWTTTIKTFTQGTLDPNHTIRDPSNTLELDYLVKCGLLKSMLNVAFKVRKPYSPDYALDIIARFLAKTTDVRYIDDLIRNEDLFFKIKEILIECEISTVRGSAMDVLSAIFGTSLAASYLAEMDPEIFHDLVKMLIIVGETTPEMIISELTSADDFEEEKEEEREPESEQLDDENSGEGDGDSVSSVNRALYQLDILNISYAEVEAYSPRWSEIIRDRSMMAFFNMMRSLCASGGRNGEHPILAEFLCNSDILNYLSNSIREKLPASFPETDRPLEAAVCLALLCNGGQQAAEKLVLEHAVDLIGQAILFLLSENAEEVMDLFYELENYLPANLVLENLSELADIAVSNRSLQLAALVHALASLCKFCPKSCESAGKIFRRLLEIGLGNKDIGGGNTPSYVRGPNPCIDDHQIRKIFLARGIRIGDRYTSILYCPTVMDSACLGLHRLQDKVTVSQLQSKISLRAEELRQMGNAEFTAKKYQSARDYFGLAFELAECCQDPVRCCCLTNRAECNLQLRQWVGAREDAEKSLSLCKPSHTHFKKTANRRERAMKHMENRGEFAKGVEV